MFFDYAIGMAPFVPSKLFPLTKAVWADIDGASVANWIGTSNADGMRQITETAIALDLERRLVDDRTSYCTNRKHQKSGARVNYRKIQSTLVLIVLWRSFTVANSHVNRWLGEACVRI